MSLQQFRQELHISVSAIKCFLKCPRSFEYRYVRGEPPAFVPVPLVFGSAFHEALAAFYRWMKTEGAAPPRELLEDVFRDAWERGATGPVPLQPNDESAAGAVDKAMRMIAAFYSVAAESPVPIESVEKPFSVEIADPDTGEVLEERLVGAFDVVLVGPPAMLLEHKTSSRRYGKDQLRHDLQPAAYQLAARELGLGDVGVTLQVVTKTADPVVQVEEVERDEKDEADFLRTSVGVLKAVDAGVFYPVRGPMCWSCPFRDRCEARTSG